MWGFLTQIGNGLKVLVGLVLPLFGKARGFQGLNTTLRWIIHVVLLAAIVFALSYVNEQSGLWKLVDTPRYPKLAHYWLPILFLAVYALCWLSWWLWKLLVPEETVTHFPDLDNAWAAALAAMSQAGIDLTEAPLFLILGEPEARHQALFQASQLKLQVNPAPESPDAPLHVYANRDAIYVTCPTASLMARQAVILAGSSEPTSRGRAALTTPAGEINTSEVPVGLEREDRPRPSLLCNTKEVEELTARLEHLCRLIVRDRWPFCPVNGLLVLVPFAATDSDSNAETTGDVCRRELAIVRSALKVQCPLFALVCDLETAPGFTEFVGCFTDKERQQRMGQRCPLVPALRRHGTAMPDAAGGDENLSGMFASLARWLCSSFFPGWVYKKFRVETVGKEDTAAVVSGNARLFLFLDQVRERQSRLGNLLTHALAEEPEVQPLFGGCYFAGTGRDPGREQAFVAGVFRRLPEEQNWVSWNPQALSEEAVYQGWIRLGWILLGILLVGALGLLGYYVFGSGPTPSSRF